VLDIIGGYVMKNIIKIVSFCCSLIVFMACDDKTNKSSNVKAISYIKGAVSKYKFKDTIISEKCSQVNVVKEGKDPYIYKGAVSYIYSNRELKQTDQLEKKNVHVFVKNPNGNDETTIIYSDLIQLKKDMDVFKDLDNKAQLTVTRDEIYPYQLEFYQKDGKVRLELGGCEFKNSSLANTDIAEVNQDRCTSKYESGKFSFYIDGKLFDSKLFDREISVYDISFLSTIKSHVLFFDDICKGKIHNLNNKCVAENIGQQLQLYVDEEKFGNLFSNRDFDEYTKLKTVLDEYINCDRISIKN